MVTNLTRRGIYALPAAGLLTAAPWVFFVQQPSIKTDPDGYARSLTASGTALAGYLYLTGLICLLFGMLALYSYLARTRGSSWAAAGMMISVIAIVLALPVIGILGLGNAVLADVYLAGHKDVGAALLLFEGGTLSDRIKTYIGVLIYIGLAGAIAYIIAVWKSGSLPRVAGVLVAAGFALSVPLLPFIGWVGALCLVIGGLWLARYISHHPPRARVAERNSNVADAGGLGPEASRPPRTAES